MAKFISGQLEINISYLNKSEQYRARVCPRSKGESSCETVHVGVPPASRLSVDSREAYADAARAAISFASNDLREQADHDGTRWDLQAASRKRKTR